MSLKKSPSEQFESLSNQTIASIDQMILELIDSISDDEKRTLYHDKFRKEVLKKKKAIHIEFLSEVLDLIDDDCFMVVEENNVGGNEDNDNNICILNDQL